MKRLLLLHLVNTDKDTRGHSKMQRHTHKHTYAPVAPPGLVRPNGGWGISMLLCRVATAMSFLLCMQSFVTSSSAFTSSAVLCFTAAPGSKLKTWTHNGYSNLLHELVLRGNKMGKPIDKNRVAFL